MYRLNTYPLIHLGFIHAFLNTLALAPLLERFESDHGTLLTAAMFFGRKEPLTIFSSLCANAPCVASTFHSSCGGISSDRAWVIEREYSGHGSEVRMNWISYKLKMLSRKLLTVLKCLGLCTSRCRRYQSVQGKSVLHVRLLYLYMQEPSDMVVAVLARVGFRHGPPQFWHSYSSRRSSLIRRSSVTSAVSGLAMSVSEIHLCIT